MPSNISRQQTFLWLMKSFCAKDETAEVVSSKVNVFIFTTMDGLPNRPTRYRPRGAPWPDSLFESQPTNYNERQNDKKKRCETTTEKQNHCKDLQNDHRDTLNNKKMGQDDCKDTKWSQIYTKCCTITQRQGHDHRKQTREMTRKKRKPVQASKRPQRRNILHYY